MKIMPTVPKEPILETRLGEDYAYCTDRNRSWKLDDASTQMIHSLFCDSHPLLLRLAIMRFSALFMLPIGSASAAALWKKLPATGLAPQNRSSPATGTIGNDVYTFGGLFDNFAAFQNTFYNDLFKFDTTTNTWTELTPTGPLPDARTFAASTALGSELFVYGGSSYDPSFFPFTVYDDLWAYDSVTNEWREIVAAGPSPGQRNGAILVADECNDKLYLYGGLNGFFQFFSDVWEFDVLTETWTELVPASGSPVPPPRDIANAGKTALNGKIVIYGGEGAAALGFPTLEDVWEFDIATQTWTDRTPTMTMISPHRNFAASENINGDLYVHAGDIPGGAAGCGAPFLQALTDDIWRLKINANGQYKWNQVTDYTGDSDALIDLKRQSSSVVNGKMYVLGGFDFDCPTGEGDGQIWNNDIWVFDPDTDDDDSSSSSDGGGCAASSSSD